MAPRKRLKAFVLRTSCCSSKEEYDLFSAPRECPGWSGRYYPLCNSTISAPASISRCNSTTPCRERPPVFAMAFTSRSHGKVNSRKCMTIFACCFMLPRTNTYTHRVQRARGSGGLQPKRALRSPELVALLRHAGPRATKCNLLIHSWSPRCKISPAELGGPSGLPGPLGRSVSD